MKIKKIGNTSRKTDWPFSPFIVEVRGTDGKLHDFDLYECESSDCVVFGTPALESCLFKPYGGEVKVELPEDEAREVRKILCHPYGDQTIRWDDWIKPGKGTKDDWIPIVEALSKSLEKFWCIQEGLPFEEIRVPDSQRR